MEFRHPDKQAMARVDVARTVIKDLCCRIEINDKRLSNGEIFSSLAMSFLDVFSAFAEEIPDKESEEYLRARKEIETLDEIVVEYVAIACSRSIPRG